MIKYLKQFKEEIPEWLEKYTPGDSITFDMVMSGRTGYYPGSGNDGNLVSVANKAHCVHSYLYVDYGVENEKLTKWLEENSFRGYHSLGRVTWTEQDIMPNGQFPLTTNYRTRLEPRKFIDDRIKPYCFTEIFERDYDMGDEWGANRFAITFLFADGIATYYQLYVRQYKKAPWIFLLQDHGFGGNYEKFGKGGLLDAIIKESTIRPYYVICDLHTEIWNGYEKLENTDSTFGGMHHSERRLFKREED